MKKIKRNRLNKIKKSFNSFFSQVKIKIFQLTRQVSSRKSGFLVLICVCLALTIFVWRTLASAPTNIKAEGKFAWSENGGWLNFGSNDGGIMVADSALTGYIWSENFGWISLNCSNNNSCATANYKVSNDNEGHLSGYAWGENIGWVNFAPTNGGVQINSEGIFSGYAWGENIGWVIFSCVDVNSCLVSDFKVKTTWLPLSVRDQNANNEEVDGVEISDVHFSTTDSTVVINWKTNHDADSHLRWGENKNLEKEKNNNAHKKKHQIILRDLSSDAEYYFRLKSTDDNDQSDNSKVYRAKTKPKSTIFVKRQWENFDKEKGSEQEYEKVEVRVTDKSKEEIKKDEKLVAVEINKDVVMSRTSGPSFIAKTFDGLKKGISGFFSGTSALAISGQGKISDFFAQVGERFVNTRNAIVAKFNKEKATEVARINQAKFFTTQVFNRDEKKLLAEVKFQILDKSDNPLPNLETTLFSDPQNVVTDENGVASFKDVPIGSHTLVFDYQGENFQKKVAIADTLTEDGKVRAEVVQVKAEKEKVALWMWSVIVLLVLSIVTAGYFAKKYYQLKKQKNV